MDLLARAQLRARIRSCTDCALHEGVTPTPWSGGADVVLAVLGQAPGAQEQVAGEPFVGPSGRLLRNAFLDIGIDHTTVGYYNAASCYPPKDRPPGEGELAACASHRDAQLEVLNPHYVLLAGSVALWTFRTDVHLAEVHGVPMTRDGRVFWPTYHPSAALRNMQARAAFRTDIRRLRVFMDRRAAGADIADLLATKCVRCGDGMWHLDPWGAPWCRYHWDMREAADARDRERIIKAYRKQQKQARKDAQGAMDLNDDGPQSHHGGTPT